MKGNVVNLAKAKAAKSKAAKGANGIGHNSSGRQQLSPEQVKYFEKKLRGGLRDIAAATKEANQARGVYRSDRKEAKKAGYNLNAFDINWRLEQEDLGKIQQDYADAAYYQHVTDSPLKQISMFDSLLPPTPKSEPPGVRGFKAGESGLVNQTDNPYTPGTEDFVAWDENWTKGQAKLAESGARA